MMDGLLMGTFTPEGESNVSGNWAAEYDPLKTRSFVNQKEVSLLVLSAVPVLNQGDNLLYSVVKDASFINIRVY